MNETIYLGRKNGYVLIIDGSSIDKFSSRDELRFKEDGGVATRQSGAAGPSMSISTSQGGDITFKLQNNSILSINLFELNQRQKENPRMFNIVILNNGNKIFNFKECAFSGRHDRLIFLKIEKFKI